MNFVVNIPRKAALSCAAFSYFMGVQHLHFTACADGRFELADGYVPADAHSEAQKASLRLL